MLLWGPESTGIKVIWQLLLSEMTRTKLHTDPELSFTRRIADIP